MIRKIRNKTNTTTRIPTMKINKSEAKKIISKISNGKTKAKKILVLKVIRFLPCIFRLLNLRSMNNINNKNIATTSLHINSWSIF